MAFLLSVTAVSFAEWPHLHGPNRDNISTEKGLLKKWPEKGPDQVWTYDKCGKGYSMPSFADGKIFLTGDFDDVEKVFALDMNGKLLWETENGKSWTGPYPGSRTTPAYYKGMVYHLNPTGRLAAFDAKTGKEIWTVDVVKEFEGRFGYWAMSENIVVDDDKVFCMPGGKKALVAALDYKTGKTLWTNTDLDEVATYTSPIIITYKGVRQLIALAQKSVISVDVKTGKMLWHHSHPTRYNQAVNSPLFHDGYVFVTSGHSGGSRLLKINEKGDGVKEVWYDVKLDNCHGDVLLVDGYLYGSSCRSGGKIFFCVDFLTGKVVKSENLRKTSLTWADGHLYSVSDRGVMMLMKTKPGGYDIVSKVQLPRQKGELYLGHPVIFNGRLYVRYADELYVFRITPGK